MQKQLLKFITEGYKNDEIADMPYISVKTVTGHGAHIKQKLHIYGYAQLAGFAIRKRIIELKR